MCPPLYDYVRRPAGGGAGTDTMKEDRLPVEPAAAALVPLVKDAGGHQDEGLVVSHGDGGGGRAALLAAAGAAATGPAATAGVVGLDRLAGATAVVANTHRCQPPFFGVGGLPPHGQSMPRRTAGCLAARPVEKGKRGLLISEKRCIIPRVLICLVAEQGRTSRKSEAKRS